MYIHLYENENDLSSLFQAPIGSIPFLGSDIKTFTKEGLDRQSAVHRTEVKINEGLGDYPEEHEILLLVPMSSVLVGDIPREDIVFMEQNPDKLFSNNGVIGGFVAKSAPPKEPEPAEHLFKEFWPVTVDNFLSINQTLVERLSFRGANHNESLITYGSPVVLSESVHNSTVCAPCYIGKGVSVQNSYIGAGTILTGGASVSNAKVFSSFIAGGYFSGEADDVLSIFSRVENFTLGKGTKLPYGTVLVK